MSLPVSFSLLLPGDTHKFPTNTSGWVLTDLLNLSSKNDAAFSISYGSSNPKGTLDPLGSGSQSTFAQIFPAAGDTLTITNTSSATAGGTILAIVYNTD